ncbi:MAG: hypothetical protein FWD18_07570 [Micrococcales bacterium]|nr:hypothetical protein [Micrococcales bacterium]
MDEDGAGEDGAAKSVGVAMGQEDEPMAIPLFVVAVARSATAAAPFGR